MLINALKQSLDVAKNQIGAVAIVVDPIDGEAVAFYTKIWIHFTPKQWKNVYDHEQN